jgi:hypothetical protein
LCRLYTIHPGHPDVHQDRIRPVLAGCTYGIRAIGSLQNLEARARKHRGEALSVALVVIHEQDGFG